MPTPPPTTPDQVRPGPARTKERLVRAALDLFTNLGYHESTTPRIAARAGVAEGTIYRHFQSKEQLLNEIFRAGVRLFQRAAGDVGPGKPAGTQLDQLGRAWCDIAAREPAVARLVFSRELHRYLDAPSRTALERLDELVVSIIATGKAHGTVRDGPATTWALVWIRLVSLAVERIAGGAWRPGDATVDYVLGAAWNAIRFRAPTEGGQPFGNR